MDDSNHVYSTVVSRTLDSLGYNEEMVKCRVQNFETLTKRIKIPKNEDTTLIFAGSKAEGLTLPFESDTDMMWMSSNIICAEAPRQVTNFHDYTTVFQMDRLHTPPGYSQLKLVTHGDSSFKDAIDNSLIPSEGRDFIVSSDIFRKKCDTSNIIPQRFIQDQDIKLNHSALDMSGPSCPFLVNGLGVDMAFDSVNGFYCDCPAILEVWANRHRMHGWPTLELVHDILSDGPGTVVPVGFKGSDNQHTEWRICFTTAEQNLIHSLNDTQKKLYILLKMVAKNIIHPVFTDITSYVMKNIVLWLAELTPQELFSEELLIDRLMHALNFLRHSVITNGLPSYMIPQRNLLTRKLTSLQRNQLAAELSNCIQQGGTILLKCSRLNVAMVKMYKTPRDATKYGRKRDAFEKVHHLMLAMWFDHANDLMDIRQPTLLKMMNLMMQFDEFPALMEKLWNVVNDLASE